MLFGEFSEYVPVCLFVARVCASVGLRCMSVVDGGYHEVIGAQFLDQFQNVMSGDNVSIELTVPSVVVGMCC